MNAKPLLHSVFALMALIIVFSVYHGFCRSDQPEKEPAIESLYVVPTAPFVFAEVELTSPYNVESVTITEAPYFYVTHVDESVGLIAGHAVYWQQGMPKIMVKCISFAYYPERGQLYAHPGDAADPGVLISHLEDLAHRSDEVDISFYGPK